MLFRWARPFTHRGAARGYRLRCRWWWAVALLGFPLAARAVPGLYFPALYGPLTALFPQEMAPVSLRESGSPLLPLHGDRNPISDFTSFRDKRLQK